VTTTTTTEDPTVTLGYEGDHIATITLDNPPSNTLSWGSRDHLKRALDELDANLDIRCLVVTGTGRAFTAGANLREDQEMSNEHLTDFLADFGRILDGLEHFRAPVVAAINGATIGGGLEFALACDIRIASDDAFFVAAGVNVGLIANFWRLPRITGLGPAKDLLLTGSRWDAEQALRFGLVTEVHPPEELWDAALNKARRIATRAPLSVENTKECANVALEMDRESAHEQQVERFLRMFATEDHQEALRAFFDKRDGDYERR
jgi:enoyl-CoA hydratase